VPDEHTGMHASHAFATREVTAVPQRSAKVVRRLRFYGTNYAPEPTGIGPYTADLAEEFAARGYEVSVVTAFPHYPNWAVDPEWTHRARVTAQRNGVTVRRLWTKVPSRVSGLRRSVFEASYLVHALLQHMGPADLVVGVSPGLGSGIAAVINGRLFRRPTVLIVQDLNARALTQSGIESFPGLGRLVRSAETLALRWATHVIVITPSFVSALEEMGVPPERITVLPNWARRPVAELSPRPRNPQPLLVHAGSMGVKQGLEQIIDAARLAHEQGLNWRFLLLGGGADRPRLEGLAEGLPNVEFRSPVPEAELPELLAQADLFLLSQASGNLDMSFPSKLTTYFGAGRPVVASVPAGGTVDRFALETGAAESVAAGNSESLLAGINRLLTDDRRYADLVSAARCHLQREWDRAELLETWTSAITSVPG
jgi:colanic acid biosynthesis glycosyl transferase WcaI